MKTFELRKKFIDFFTSTPRSHKEIPSAPLVPENDPTSLFTSSGMQPLITYLLGEKHPLGTRLVDSQKSFRSQDIEEIGDNRHTTFFEMLGNWSLGDYFKKEQLPWIFEFLTKKLELDPKRLYVSVFEGNQSVPKDTESIGIWKEIFEGVGIEAKIGERIFTYPANKNWWSRSGEPEKMPPGEPGGPDSEVFFDFGEDLKIHEKSIYKDDKCHPNCDCGRFLEIANSVFMQYQKQADGTLSELPNKNVDFGGGLERMVAAANDNPDVFQIDIFIPIIKKLEEHSGNKYGDNIDKDKSMRIIADHLRAAVMLINDGVTPGNKQQGYVLRRLIRRAEFHRQKLFLTIGNITFSSLAEGFQEVYPEIKNKWQQISQILDVEYQRFDKLLQQGKSKLNRVIENKITVDGKLVFDLYQTYGFPMELTLEILHDKGLTYDEKDQERFALEFKKHQDLSRTASKGMFKGGLQDHSETTTRLHTATHLLQQSLRVVLGNHVRQKGSHITAERLRFDFSHPEKITQEQLKKVENLVNEQIKNNLPVTMKIITLDEALKEGALTVIGASYPDQVKVYSAGTFSKEVCGGPHVVFTGSLGEFKIIKEEAVGNNIRRIYATLKENNHVIHRKDSSEKRH